MTLLGAALLLLASFEAVFATNVIHRLLFGPPPQNITGYLYLWEQGAAGRGAPTVLWTPALLAIAASLPAGWLIAGVHHEHDRLALALFALAVALCAIGNLGSPFGAQFATMLLFVAGMLAGGRLTAPAQPPAGLS